MRVTGEQRRRHGRRALVLESVPAKWITSDPGSRGTALVDAETYAVLQTQSILGDGQFNQTVDTTVDELVEREGAGHREARRTPARRREGQPRSGAEPQHPRRQEFPPEPPPRACVTPLP